ncbi:hypothetical protein MG293_018965 [Ovis ammon polii]|uniref:PKHD1 ciliary IPT domain containing fibrocystin/polyductin n=1 Tax=Ovis ammon polii TaxID=230172 RepID=A0AAD4TMZ5_OVIAM|nr:hypothetical protein MG293_018965 [Ovis ammon polii]
MTGSLIYLTSIKILLLAGLELGLLHPANGSQLEIHLVNVALPTLPSIPCDVSPVFLDVPAVMCRTRGKSHGTLPKNIIFKSRVGKLIHVYGWIITGRSETFDFDAEYIDSPLILEAQGDKWITPCSLVNRQTGSRSVIHKDAWLVSAKQDLFLYQTYSEILSVFPETGSLGGSTDITITGDFFDNPAQVTIAGIPCDIRHVSPRRIECTTRALSKGARLSAPQAGNRGLLFEVGDASEDLDLTEATPGYSWQIAPNASSPSGFWSKEGQPFRARLSGFFVAPETNNYTFWIQADNQASLYFSWSEDLRTKVKMASIRVGTADWFDSWEQNGSDKTQQQKTPKLELRGGARYYLEAEHRGTAPSSGVRIGVQIHNTWLNPDVVSTYLREKHQIRAWAQRLPEIQMLTVSGTGNFFLTWDNVSSQPIPANATAHQIQTAVEELLAVKCKLEPLAANILLWQGFEQGLEGSTSDGHLTSGTEPFCGRFSLHQPRHLVLTPPAAQKVYRLDQYTHLCLAYRGHENTTLKMTVSFTVGLQNPVKNLTCDWSLLGTSPSAVPTEGAEEGSGLVQVTTRRLQRTSPPLGGHFRIQLSNTAIPGVPVHISASHLQKLLQTSADDFTSRYLNVSDFTVTEDLKSCYEHVWTFSWSSQVGDLPNFIKVSNENLTGVKPAVITRVVYDGGVFLGPIFGDMLVTANRYTQVAVRVNDIPAYCSGSCAFQYLEGSTPQVYSVWYALDAVGLLVYITGTSFSGDYKALQVTVNKTSCKVIFSNQTNVVCQTSLLPVGVHQILMLVRPSGLAINASGGGLFLNVEPRLDAVEPSRAADIGGLWATVRGSGLDNVNLVLFGSQSCVINVTTSSSQRIQCKVPSKGEDGPTVNVTVILGGRSVVLAMAFTYVSSLNPVIVSLSRNGSGIAGGEILSIGMVLPVNHTDLDAEVRIGDTRAWVQAQTAQGLEVVLPPLPAGLHGISVSINGVHIHAQGVDLHIQYITEVFSIQPRCGSLVGGTILSISGRGFSRDRALLWVLVGSRSCDIVNSTETSVWCETPPPAPLPLSAPVPVEVWAGSKPFPHRPSPRLVGKGFTFMYEVAATPVVTVMRGEVANHSLRLYVEGRNLSDSVVLLARISGAANIDIFIGMSPCVGVSGNHTLLHCVVPSLPTGEYQVRGYDRMRGWASSVLVFTSRVTITAVTENFVSLASLCDLRPEEEDCETSSCSYIHCDLTITVGTESLPESWPYFYICEESSRCLLARDHWTESTLPSFSGLFISPKVERDEVLIYNSSCTITMETEAKMECETPNQPITAKITEIRKSRGQNTQRGKVCTAKQKQIYFVLFLLGTDLEMYLDMSLRSVICGLGSSKEGNFIFQFCGRWSRAHSWFPKRPPQEGDNVTVEKGQLLLLDTNTSILNFLHVKGGKLIFLDLGPLELRTHSILVSDGGELRIGSEDKPFQGKARIKLYGSSYSARFVPYGVKFLAVRNGTLSLHESESVGLARAQECAFQWDHRVIGFRERTDCTWRKAVFSGSSKFGNQKSVQFCRLSRVSGHQHGLKRLLKSNGRGSLPEVVVTHLRATANAHDTVLALEDAVDWHAGDEVLVISGMGAEGAKPKEEIVTVETAHSTDLQLRSPLRYSHNSTENWVAGEHHVLKVMLVLLSRSITIQGNLTDERVQFLASCQGASASEGDLQNCLYSKSEKMLGSRDLGARVIVQSFPEEPSQVQLKGVQFRDLGQAFREHVSSLMLIGAMRGSYLQGCTVWRSFSRGLSMSQTSSLKVDSNVFYDISGHALLVGWSEQGNIIRNNVIIHVSGAEGLSSPEVVTPSGIYIRHPTNVIEIFRSSNLHLKNFQVYACRDFGIDVLESDANTSITDSLLLGHFAHRSFFQLTGGFTVKTNQLKFVNSPNLVAFPSPHAAILEDLDGSLSGKNRSHILASMETLPASCVVKASFSQLVHGSVCEENVLFHRMSIGLANALNISHDLTITDSRNKTTTVSYVHDTLSNPYGWMALLLDQETYSLRFKNPWASSALQYSATFDNFAPGNYLLLVHTDVWVYPDILIRCGSHVGQSLSSLPSPGRDQGCDWFFDSQLRQLTYLASTSVPKSVLKWSLPETWEGVAEGWGGHNGTSPGPGEDVLILSSSNNVCTEVTSVLRCARTGWAVCTGADGSVNAPGFVSFLFFGETIKGRGYIRKCQHLLIAVTLATAKGPKFCRLATSLGLYRNADRTVLVDTDLPLLRGLYVMGTLEFPVDRSNILSVACMLIAGGELRVGTSENPLEKEKKLLIHLRASEGVFCDRFNGIHIDPGTVGVFGKVQLHSAYPKKSWTRLGADIASGNERIIVEDTVDWRPHDKIVLSSSSYEPHEAEVLTVKEVRGHHIRIHERLRHRHIGILQLFNVEIQNFGSPLHSSIELTNVSAGSWIISSSLHQSCGGGIHAAASQGVILNDNVVFSTAGHGIDLEGQDYSLSKNLVVLMTQSAWSPVWVAGIKVNKAKNTHLHGNVVAGSERLGFHIQGHRCSSPESLWSDNVAHSSLHGLHLYKGSGLVNCTGISGFLAFKNFDYGAMLQVENSMEIENLTLVDNTVGLFTAVYVSSAPRCYIRNLQIVLRNSVIVATSSSFDCIQDRVKPHSANLTSPDRAPSNPKGGRVGMLWPVFTSEPNRWPQEPWHKVRNGHLILGIMKLQDVTFSSFVKSCYSDDLDVCILPNAENTGIVPPIMAERTSMLKIKDKNKFYFPPLQTRKDLETLVCSESDCESPGKYLFKDLDGRALGLPPPVSVFPKTEAEWTGSFFNTETQSEKSAFSLDFAGIFREEQKCTYRPLINGYICKQTDQVILILDSADTTWAMQKLYPVVSVTSGFVDTFSSINASAPCSISRSVSAFYSIVPTRKITKVCFVDQTPRVLHFFLLGNKNTSKLLLAVFYHELQSPYVFLGDRFIPPTQVHSASSLLNESIGANYFSITDNLLYVVLQGEEPIEIQSSVSIHLALNVMFSVLEKGWEIVILERLTVFLQISQDQIRFIHQMPGNEATLKAMADSRAKRKRNCPTVTCTSHDRVIIAQQTGLLESVLNMTIGALLVTQSKGVIGYGLSVLVQPSDGEVGKELTIQPQLVFLDKQNRRVESLGPPSEPWVISVSLEGTLDSVLRGCTHAGTQDGYVSFSNLAVLISGSNWHFIFTVISPPEIKNEEISETQTNDQRNHSHVSPKHQGSQVETEKEVTRMAEDLRMKVMLAKLNQLPHQSLNGVSRRKVSHRVVREEGGSREEATVPAPSIASVTSHRNTCTPGSPAQQECLQESRGWKGAQEQVLRYQLAGQDQLLLLCPDLRRERQRLQGQSQLGKGHISLELSQEKPGSCGATEAFCLHSVHPEAVQEQL